MKYFGAKFWDSQKINPYTYSLFRENFLFITYEAFVDIYQIYRCYNK